MTTLFEQISELSLYGPFDRNVPNSERLILIANESLNLARYSIALGVGGPQQTANILNDHLFWLGDLQVDAGTWIYVYTGSGQMQFTTVPGVDARAIVMHWNSAITLFSSKLVVPVLLRFGGIYIPALESDAIALPTPQT